jgi:hypothetical protein
MSAKYIYSVVEDNGGGLTLYVFAADDHKRTIPVYAHSGYEHNPAALRTDTAALADADADISDWEGCDPDPQASWDELDDYEYGYRIIADETGPIAEERMGAAGRSVYYI